MEHESVGKVLVALRKYGKGDVIGPSYGSVAYHDLRKESQSTKMHGTR